MPRRLLLIAPLVLLLAVALATPAGAKTHWLCKPGMSKNPCSPSMSTTLVSPTGKVIRTYTPKRDARPRYDCFYVYPTTSDEKTPQADFRATPELKSIALYQTARYSLHCRVFAPVYRQITIQGLLHPNTVTTAMRASALKDVQASLKDYLKHDNHGRGIVFIGHSQGSFVLRQVLAASVDKTTLRKRLISAVLMGGNVLVKPGSALGGDFKHIPACRPATKFGCVVAFSTYGSAPPANSLFGRGGTGTMVLCTNPAGLGKGSALLDSIQPVAPFAPSVIGSLVPSIGLKPPKTKAAWFELRGAYSGRCSSAGGANVLRITPRGGAPALNALPDATWGLHLADANIALGNLVGLVDRQARAYLKAHPG